MLAHIRPALMSLAAFTVICGIAYPLAVTGIAQLVFPQQAAGSLIVSEGKAMGSSLVGQPFSDARYFWSRSSATAPFPYHAAASGGSNQGPLNPALREAVARRIEALRAADPGNMQPVPVDLVTASASGLDPHISPAAAAYQVNRVAWARGLAPQKVRALVQAQTEPRLWGILGEPRVDVLRLNLALDARGKSVRPGEQ